LEISLSLTKIGSVDKWGIFSLFFNIFSSSWLCYFCSSYSLFE
jgi:hypothetical protein